MTGPDESQPPNRRPAWAAAATVVAIAVMAAIALAIYLGLTARGRTWPVYVFAVASAPLALLAAAQGIQALAKLTRQRGDGDV